MSVRIVRLGSPRHAKEGLRIGTVRRLPRGIRKENYASENWFDVWYPELAPSAELVKKALAAETAADWARFERAFRSEMNRPQPKRTLDLLAALSHQTSFSVGCYCEDEARCHRSILRRLLAESGADLAT
jgi:uncharacterized protein YeaO (DUF488 family)